MKDLENQIYTRLANAVRKACPNANVSSTYINAPSKFPCVTIEQIDSYDLSGSQTEVCEDANIVLVFEVNIYSNHESNKKTECKKIMRIVNDEFKRMNFKRTAMTPVPNLENATIYRLFGRFSAVTDGNYLYRR